jgi:hypothetical protein
MLIVDRDNRVLYELFALAALGLIVADNGSDMYISGAFDPRWDNGVLNPAFGALTANDFEVIQLGWTGNCATPGPRQGLSSIVNGQLVQLSWSPPTSGGQSGYIIEAGSASGLPTYREPILPGIRAAHEHPAARVDEDALKAAHRSAAIPHCVAARFERVAHLGADATFKG